MTPKKQKKRRNKHARLSENDLKRSKNNSKMFRKRSENVVKLVQKWSVQIAKHKVAFIFSAGGMNFLIKLNWSISDLNVQVNPTTCLGGTGCWIQQVTAATLVVTC